MYPSGCARHGAQDAVEGTPVSELVYIGPLHTADVFGYSGLVRSHSSIVFETVFLLALALFMVKTSSLRLAWSPTTPFKGTSTGDTRVGAVCTAHSA